MKWVNEINSSENNFDFSLLNNEIISIHKEINDRENHNELWWNKRYKKGKNKNNSECENNNRNKDITDKKFQIDNMHRIEKYTAKNIIFNIPEKSAKPQWTIAYMNLYIII